MLVSYWIADMLWITRHSVFTHFYSVRKRCCSCKVTSFQLPTTNSSKYQLIRQLQFTLEDLHNFGLLITETLKILIPFTTSYPCGKSFFSIVALKTKYSNCLLSLEKICFCFSNVNPHMGKLLNKKIHCNLINLW